MLIFTTAELQIRQDAVSIGVFTEVEDFIMYIIFSFSGMGIGGE